MFRCTDYCFEIRYKLEVALYTTPVIFNTTKYFMHDLLTTLRPIIVSYI
jgi:hypothetical protein